MDSSTLNPLEMTSVQPVLSELLKTLLSAEKLMMSTTTCLLHRQPDGAPMGFGLLHRQTARGAECI